MELHLNRFPGGRDKALLFSFDDGRIEDRRLVSLMNQYGLKGTFHLNSGNIGKEKYVRPEEIRTLYAGHEVAGHTRTHVFLGQVPARMRLEELMADRECLEALSGQIVRGLSWPYGSFDPEISETARICGYEYSRTTVDTNQLQPPEDLLAWNPTMHHSGVTAELWRRFLDNHRDDMRMMMIWGHSYEVDTEEKWAHLSEMFRKMGGRQDVWYATCIQAAEYLKAARRLVVSASMHRVYNPSAVTVWVEADGKNAAIPGGAEISL